MKKLPKIYQNEINKKINNNKTVFDSLKEEEFRNSIKEVKKDSKVNQRINLNNLSVREKLKELINKNSYIFNTKVTLVFSDHEEVSQIAGVVNNHIITMDNKIIKIDELKDIKFLEK